MLGWFKRKDPNQDWVLAEIKRLKGLLKHADAASRAGFSMALGIHWEMFVAANHGLAEFRNLPRQQQMNYFRKYVAFVETARGDPVGDIAMDFIIQLLSATIMQDRRVEADLRVFLQPYLKSGTLV